MCSEVGMANKKTLSACYHYFFFLFLSTNYPQNIQISKSEINSSKYIKNLVAASQWSKTELVVLLLWDTTFTSGPSQKKWCWEKWNLVLFVPLWVIIITSCYFKFWKLLGKRFYLLMEVTSERGLGSRIYNA